MFDDSITEIRDLCNYANSTHECEIRVDQLLYFLISFSFLFGVIIGEFIVLLMLIYFPSPETTELEKRQKRINKLERKLGQNIPDCSTKR